MQDDPTTKTLIFCSFARMLEYAALYLAPRGFACIRYTGKQSLEERAKAVKEFGGTGPDCPSVMLISTTAGGGGWIANAFVTDLKCLHPAGLNLTAANKVIILNPSWSPATEAQVFARAHRLVGYLIPATHAADDQGQTRPVQIERLVMRGTVEERILAKLVLPPAPVLLVLC